jgi:hypothetical protein
MTIANLKIGQQKYVVLREKDFHKIQQESRRYQRMVEEDRVLGELAMKELRAYRKTGKGTPWEEVKKKLGF